MAERLLGTQLGVRARRHIIGHGTKYAVRRDSLMKSLVAIALLLTPVLAQKQEFTIEKYEFVWEAYYVQGVDISVMKNEITTRFSLHQDTWFPMSAQEALRLAEDLKSAVKLQMAEETTEEKTSILIQGPPFLIDSITESTLRIWHTSIAGSEGRTSIADNEVRIELNIEQAKAIVPYLEKAPRMIAFVDSLIHF